MQSEQEYAILVDVNYMEHNEIASSIFASLYCEFRIHGFTLENRMFIKKGTDANIKSDLSDIMKNLAGYHGTQVLNIFIKHVSMVKKSTFKNIKNDLLK